MSPVQNITPNNKDETLDPSQVIYDYLNLQHVLTLCCHDSELLWCASCFYVFEQDTMSFLIMTDSKTRHGKLIEKNANVAGTVSGQDIDIVELKGIQFAGSISLLIGDKEDAARRNYYDRFPVARLIPSPIWRLKIDEIKMTDNTAGFANKYIWKRS